MKEEDVRQAMALISLASELPVRPLTADEAEMVNAAVDDWFASAEPAVISFRQPSISEIYFNQMLSGIIA